MKKKLAYIMIFAMLASSMSACAAENTSTINAYAQFEANYTNRDCDPSYDASAAIKITEATTITKEGVYIVTGDIKGTITINTDEKDKVRLVLKNASITSEDGPAIYVEQCDKVFITLEGTNTVSDSEAYSSEDYNAAIYATCNITFNGSGSLTVNGNYKHGVYTKDDLKITGGTITVNSVSDGLKGKDSVLVKDGTINITAGADGIQSSNDSGEEKGRISLDGGNITIVSGNDGVQAESVLQVNGATVDIKAGDEANTETKSSGMGGGQPGGGMGMGGGRRNPEPQNSDDKQGDENKPNDDGMQNAQPGSGRGGNRGGRPDGEMQIPQGGRPDGEMQMPQSGRPDGEMQIPQGGRPDGEMQIPQGGRPDGEIQMPQGGQPNGDMKMPQDTTETESSESIKGLKSGNAIYINSGNITIASADDSIHANQALEINGGTLSLRTADDGIHAEYECVINDGEITIERSYEGIEGKTVIINGGNIDVKAEDDGINSRNPDGKGQEGRGDSSVYIKINGGNVNVVSGFDSLDSNGDIYITGGAVTLDGPSNGMDCAIDCDGSAYISGGYVAASGLSTASTTFSSESEQGSISVIYTSNQSAGTTVTLYDENSNELATITPMQSFRGVVFSTEELAKGKSYTVKTGSVTTEVTLSELTTVVSDTGEAVSSSNEAPGGMPAGQPGDMGGHHGGKKISFNDVSSDVWYSPYVDFVATMGIMEGKNGEFKPETVTTRAEYVLALYKAMGSPEVEATEIFADVSANSEYAKAIAWAAANGIAEGDGTGNFLPDASLTREMSMTFMYRALFEPSDNTDEDCISSFVDGADVSDWAKKPMNTLVKLGIITGTDDGKLNPQNVLNNAEVATMVCRALVGNIGGTRRA